MQRLISSLALRGYIEKNSETARYRWAIVRWSSGRAASVPSTMPSPRAASSNGWRTSTISTASSRCCAAVAPIYLLAVQADGPVAIKVSPGSEMPLHSTSAGKVLLASLGDGEARKLLGGRKLAAITAHTITDPAVLVASLAKVRRQGFATVNEENIPGVLSVGAPIRDRAGSVVAALSVAFPKYLDAGLTLQSVEPLVTGAAQRISRMLGTPPAMLLTGTRGA